MIAADASWAPQHVIKYSPKPADVTDLLTTDYFEKSSNSFNYLLNVLDSELTLTDTDTSVDPVNEIYNQ